MNFTRRHFIAATGLGAVGAVTASKIGTKAPGSQGRVDTAPLLKTDSGHNLLILMVDQERALETLPEHLKLPNHKRLRDISTSFTQMNVTTALCTPSRSVFWTGQHVQNTKVMDNSNVPMVGREMSPAIPTLGHMLREAGVYTAYKGKWHLHELPTEAGYDRAPERFDALEDFGYSDYGWGLELVDSQDGFKYDHRIADDAVHWLNGKGADLAKDGQNWALTVSFVNPHDIMYFDATGEQHATRVQNVFPGPVLTAPENDLYNTAVTDELPKKFRSSDVSGRLATQKDYEDYMDMFYGPMPHDNHDAWKRFANYYYNCIRDVDRHLGTVLDALEASGQMDNTIIVLVSDHGEMGGAHGLRQKGPWMYRENLNVPFYISHPELRQSATNNGLVSALDFTPTMLGLMGVEPKRVEARYPDVKGKDLSSYLQQHSTPRSENNEGALVTYSVLHHTDPTFAAAVLKNKLPANPVKKFYRMAREGFVPGLSPRSFMRGIITDDYKFARYFSPAEHHLPLDWKTLIERNDLELFDLKNDPDETINLAAAEDIPVDVVLSLNDQLNRLIEKEVGIDDGSSMAGPSIIWRG